jgi:YbbR domain-containing protein
MEKSNRRRILHALIAILTALVLWVYVDNRSSAESKMTVRDIPVEFVGEDTSLADKNLMLLSGYDTTVDLRLKGPRKVLWQMDTDAIRVVVDCSSITEEGQQSLDYTVRYPDSVSRSSVSVDSASVYTITVTVGELYKKEVPVQCDVIGQVANGFFAGELQLDVETLTLRAPREDLLNVSYAKVSLTVSGATSTVVEALEYTLYDYNNVPVSNSNIRSSTKLIQAILPVRTVKEVPLAIDLVGVPTNLDGSVEYTIDPETVQIMGEAETLENVSSIVLDKVYVEDLSGYQVFNYDIIPPVGTTLVSDTTVATVSIISEGAGELTLELTDITTENVADGLRATVSDSVTLTLWGQNDLLELVTAADVMARVDLSNVTEEGTYVLPLSLTLTGYDKVTIKGDYTVTVEVTARSGEETEEGGTNSGNTANGGNNANSGNAGSTGGN